MRKDAFKTHIQKYPDNFRRKTLENVLKEGAFKYYTNDKRIYFGEIYDFLATQGLLLDPTFFSRKMSFKDFLDCFLSEKKLSDLRTEKKEEKEIKKEKGLLFLQQSWDNLSNISSCIAAFLNPKDTAIFSACSYFVYQQVISAVSWRHKILALGVNEKILDEAIASKLIHNYKELYRTLSLTQVNKSDIKTYHLFYLSGEIKSIEHVISIEGKVKEEDHGFSVSRLGHVTLSGNVDAIQYISDRLQISIWALNQDIQKYILDAVVTRGFLESIKYVIKYLTISPQTFCNEDGRNIFLMAAYYGHLEVMRYAVDVLGNSPTSCDKDGANALLLSAESQNPSLFTLRYVAEQLKIPSNNCDNKYKSNVLLRAAWRGFVEGMKYAVEHLKIPPNSRDADGRDVLLLGAYRGHVAVMKYAIEVLKIPLTSHDNLGRNILCMAAWSGCAKTVKFAMLLSFNSTLCSTSRDSNGHDAFHYASLSKNPKGITEILFISTNEIVLEFKRNEKKEEKRVEKSSNCLII